MIENPTIAAISTAYGQGAIALIRISGAECLNIIRTCWKGKPVDTLPPRQACYGSIINTKTEETLDEVLLTYFPAPHSYTGEASLEITCHGGILVSQRILEQIILSGAIPAQAGEFTQRAFLNGKMELTQAEAVMDIIHAQTDLALRAAQDQLNGSLGKRISALTQSTLTLLAHVEAHIDFPDEDISPDTVEHLTQQIKQLNHTLTQLLLTAERGRLLRHGVRTILVGRPNAGKSSLLNQLLGYDRAIVSDIAGTTRDTLEETVNVGGFPLRLTDTAGIQESQDSLEQAGITRTHQALLTADLVIEIIDASQPKKNSYPLVHHAPHYVRLLNKIDLGRHPDWQNEEGLCFSCVTQEGMEELTQYIVKSLSQQDWDSTDSQLIAINARHQHCLRQAQTALQDAHKGLLQEQSPEFIALDLRESLNALGEITGKIDTEDILGHIFSTFCIGK